MGRSIDHSTENAAGGPPLLIDTDVHNGIKRREDLLPYLPKVWHEQWLSQATGLGQPFYSPVGVLRQDAVPEDGSLPGSDPGYLIRDHVERHGFDYVILTGQNILEMALHPDLDYANAVVSAYNDYLIDHWLRVDPRLKGAMVVNPSDPAAAAKEIERVAGHPDIVEVIMASAAMKLYGQRFYHPLYEAAEKMNVPIAIHPGTEGRGMSGAPTASGYPTRYMEWHNILPTNYMAHLNSLVCEGVFEKFPTLNFIAIEGGIAWLPHLMWRMDKNYKALRDTTPWLRRLPSEYIRERVYLTTQPIEEPDNPQHLVDIVNMAGAEDRLLYSSDYPHWDFDHPRLALASFPRDQRLQILGGNAARLFGLERPAKSRDETEG